MIENNLEKDLGSEERLKTISYQFVSLYERWSEDRKNAEKLNAEFEGFLKRFKSQVDHFELLAPSVHFQIRDNVEVAIKGAAKTVSEAMKKEAAHTTERITDPLKEVTRQTLRTLESYEKETAVKPWIAFGIPIVSSIIASLLIVALLMPKATLPLTEDQINNMYRGQLFSLILPKLSEKERKNLEAIADRVTHTKPINANSGNDNV